MSITNIWVLLLLGCMVWSKPATAADPIVFEGPWSLTESEPEAWSRNRKLVQPQQLTDWKTYTETTVPPGINKTIWLQNELPLIPDQRHVLYFSNGLEDIAVYIDNKLVYYYGYFNKRWDNVSSQRWHSIPLGPEHSHRPIHIRTHYALSYVVRTLYPVIRPHAEALAEHTTRSMPMIFLAGWFGLLGIIALAMVLLRRQFDLFLYFGLMAVSVASWIIFNQDSMIKPYTGFPPRSWSYFDLIGIYLSAACLISFLSIVTQSKSRMIRWVFWLNWGMAFSVAVLSGVVRIHAWYLLPLLHIAVFPSLLVLIPLIVWSALHRNMEARVLMVGSVAMSLSAIHDILRYSSNFSSPITTMIPFGGLMMLMAMLMILVRRYQAEREEAFRTQAKLLADIQKLNAALQVHVDEVEALVEEKTREISSIMGHIQQGIFMLTGPNLQIHVEYSQHLETLLGTTELAQQRFEQAFLNRTTLGMDHRSRLLAALHASMGEDIFSFEVNAANLPSEVRLIHGQEEKILELSWAPIVDEKNLIDKILVTARDVTGLRQLQFVARQSQQETQLLHVILSAKPERFSLFLDSSLKLLGQARRDLVQGDEPGLKNAYRDLHTVKGNARSYEMEELASLVHDAEAMMVTKQQTTDMVSAVDGICAKVESYKEIFQKRFQMNVGAHQVTVDRDALEQVFREKSPTPSDQLQRFEEILLPRVFISMATLFDELAQGLDRLAMSLGKESPRIVLEANGIHFPQSTAELLSDCLGHLFRNAMDHGIESPAERLSVGKPSQGQLFIQGQSEGQDLRIRFGDDGRGLNLQSIRMRAIDRGWLREADILTEKQVEQLIFSPGFSTRTEASLVSGRGVGLDAVRAALAQRGGTIRLHFTDKDEKRGLWHFFFELRLPADCFVELSAPARLAS